MKRARKHTKLSIEGVVYCYISPSGKAYVGQTTNEAHRRRTWFCTKRRYAGYAINKARKKYGPENFKYEVLFRHNFSDYEEAISILDAVEKFYIKQYDSFNNGYNNTTGGLVPEFGINGVLNGRELNPQKTPLTKYQIRRFSPKHTKEEIQQLRKETNRRKGRWKKIYQFTLEGVFLREFASAGEAIEYLGKGSVTNIKRACRTLGTYYGYNWRFSDEGRVMKKRPQRIFKKEQFTQFCKPVIQLTLQRVPIIEYDSITSAAKALGIPYTSGISACLNGKIHTSHGYKWKYK